MTRIGMFVALGALASAQSALTVTTLTLPAATTGSPYSFTLSGSGGTTPYSWSASGIPASFTLSAGGTLSGTPGANGAGTFNVAVLITDAASHSATSHFTLLIAPGFLILTQTLANGSVGVNYSQVIQTSGGTPPISFSLASTIFVQNVLPPGLTLSAGGTLSGTPTKTGAYTFGVNATDSAGNLATATYTVSIGTPLVFSTASPLPSGVAGTGYSDIIFASGGTPPYTFSIVGNAPPGLAIDPSGYLSGTPAQIGTFTFTVQVVDSAQISATKQYQIAFSAAPSLLQTSALALDFTGLVGGDAPPAQSIAIVSTGSSSPVNYSVSVNGGAPAWLTVTPTQGVTPGRLTVRVNQGAMQAADLSATILISVPGNTSQAAINIAITFEVSGGPPQLEIVPNILTFAARSQTPGNLSQILTLRNSGGSGMLPFTVSGPEFGSRWITGISATTGSTAVNSPTFVQIQVNTNGLAVGHYNDVINFAWLGGTVNVPVTLFISDQGPILDVSLRGVRIPARVGGNFNVTTTSI